MPDTQATGMTDEQVEELLNALLNFREILLGLNDRFQNRMALLEEEFAERRQAMPTTNNQKPTASLERQTTPELGEMDEVEDFDILDDEEAFEPDETEAFSILDIDDDDDDDDF